MKKIFYFLFFCILLSCSKDETKTRQIELGYPETEINLIFSTAGSTAPVILNWDGEPGTYSISSSTGILQENVIAFDTITGHFSWGKDFPIGIYDFSITAQSGVTTTTVEITLTNTFIEGFFSGGFQKVSDPDEIILTVFNDYGLQLNENGSVSMERYSNPALIVSGNWSITDEGTLSIDFITNLSGGEITYMRGSLSFDSEDKEPLFRGLYGTSLNENQEIENLTGIFYFIWD
ncbi:hypothetical protein LCGC14_0354390 [marine sediment metagenome]|uniref:Uncharacterized protein n=1 Tax=marine sediment metagenome TaxID=412755 RepID=A0A0F9TFF7_9ZZZZ|nr:hypothetical protein [Maribacter sp.]HDZ04667.1 hypothetical protein [Maribacter sp.]HEA81574.1 hypothetical protein [Maribacter sp.]